jgi:hypothetical protein
LINNLSKSDLLGASAVLVTTNTDFPDRESALSHFMNVVSAFPNLHTPIATLIGGDYNKDITDTMDEAIQKCSHLAPSSGLFWEF